MRSARFSHIVLRNKTNVSEFLEVTRPPAVGVSSSSAEDIYSPPPHSRHFFTWVWIAAAFAAVLGAPFWLWKQFGKSRP